MNRLIFLDIDGTILDGSRGMPDISDKTRYAIGQLQKNGDHVLIASGRCKGLLYKQVYDLKPDGFILCNGAYGEFAGKEIYSYSFKEETLDRIKEVVSRYEGFYIFETLDRAYVESMNGVLFRSFADSWNISPDFFSEDRVIAPILIAMIGFKDYADFPEVIEDIREYADAIPHNGFSSFDINIKDVNKGTGVKKLLEYLDIPREDAYCFGDGANDLEMLKEVGHPVTMGNCDKALDAYGFEKTTDVLDDGVYEYLVKHKLIKAL
ncbi:MAG: HAD family phosphatase [Erysipelotrichaceae bacterium]|nr:HAD family phosphatase [Erysipelotrichaceae bacterium]